MFRRSARILQHTTMELPKLKHVLDFTAWGPAEFPYIATEHSNVCVAHGMNNSPLWPPFLEEMFPFRITDVFIVPSI